MKYWKPIGTLILISSTLPELLTGSTPIISLINPGTIFFLIVGYGLAVLVIREIAARTNAGFGGIVLMGCAYGIFNEGLFSKTMVRITNLPVPTFTGYGRILGINAPWALGIGLWHALASVLFPIILTYLLHPDQKDRPWLTKTFTIILGLLLMVFGILNFLGNNIIAGTPIQLIIFLILMAVFIIGGSRLKKEDIPESAPTKLSPTPIYLGLSVFLFSGVVLTFISGERLPILLYYLVYASGVWAYVWFMNRRGWNTTSHLALFGLGMYMEIAFTLIIAAFMQGNAVPEYLATAIIGEIALIWYARRILQHSFVAIS